MARNVFGSHIYVYNRIKPISGISNVLSGFREIRNKGCFNFNNVIENPGKSGKSDKKESPPFPYEIQVSRRIFFFESG